LCQWLNSNKFTNIDLELESNVDSIVGLLCWGYCSRTCKHSTNKIFEVHSLLQDFILKFALVTKPQTKVELELGCLEYKIDGLDIEIVHKYLIFVNHSLTSLVMFVIEFHRNLI
jgi:hypothetical protein